MDAASEACCVKLARAKSENWIPTRDLQGLVAMVQDTDGTCSIIKRVSYCLKFLRNMNYRGES